MAHTVKRHAWGSASTINAATIEAREVVIDTDVNELVVGDGSTVGGTRMQRRSAALDAIRAAGAVVADRLFYWTSSSAGAFATLTSFGRSLMAATSLGEPLALSGGVLGPAIGRTPYIAGRFYSLFTAEQATGNAYAPALDTVVSLVPFEIRRTVTLASLNIRVATGAGSSAAKLAIWASNTTTGWPTGTPIANAVSNTGQSTASNNSNATISASAVLAPGLYWYGVAVTTAAPSFRSIAQNDQGLEALIGRSSLATLTTVSGFTAPYTYSGDITTLDLTAATLTDVLGAGGVPIMYLVPA